MEKTCCGAKKAASQKSMTEKIVQYRPIIVITGVAAFAAAALAVSATMPFMRGMMGIFLLLLATLKLFNWNGFADSFAGYDILARHARGYALAYPLIELSLAWFYLTGFQPIATNTVMLAIMCIGSIGVVRVIQTGEVRKCACVGSGFDLPVGRVTLAENTVMGAMALMALLP
jgi:hypothetical protein